MGLNESETEFQSSTAKREHLASLWCPLCNFYIELVLVFPEPEEMESVDTRFLCPVCNTMGVSSRTIINLEDRAPTPDIQRIEMVPDELG